jgi:hypothetical protein
MTFSAVAGATVATIGGALISGKANRAAARANNAAADATALQAEISKDQWERYKEIYEPLERKMVDEASRYDSPENYARAAGEASATVSDQFGKARERLNRTPGLDPSSAAYQSSLTGLELSQAATDATSQNLARQGVRDTAYARKVSALGLGKGLDSSASAGLSTASSNLSRIASDNANRASNQAAAFGGLVDRGVEAYQNWSNNRAASNSIVSAANAAQNLSLNLVDSATKVSPLSF